MCEIRCDQAKLVTHVITQACCNDGRCVTVCPVQCIRPRPGDPEFTSAEQLYIDPALCIDCGACLDVCPVDAIQVDYYLTKPYQPYLDINAEYFERHPIEDVAPLVDIVRKLPGGQGSLRVTIVGAGPSGCYAADILLQMSGVEISMFDRLPTPHGLARAGVAPDHQKTKSIGAYFDSVMARPEVTCFFNVEIGRDIALEELLAHHHAVIWSAGAAGDRSLGISGETLSGSYSAREFVAWYNGHPEYADLNPDLTEPHIVIIGNGNVAIDAARMLLCDVDELDKTDIAHHAVTQLRKSRVREVTIAARRGPAEAAYSLPELLALTHLDRVSLVTRSDEVLPRGQKYARNPLKLDIVERAAEPGPLEDRRINLRYLLSPISINGEESVESITFMRNAVVHDHGATGLRPTGETEIIKTSLVLRAIGYRGRAVPGLPFDEKTGTIANVDGRVIDPQTSHPIRGYYCAGWCKRGATGVLGTNKRCSAETVDSLLNDLAAGRLSEPARTAGDLAQLIAQRAPRALDFDAWSRMNAAELREGKLRGRARSKFTVVSDMLGAAACGG